MDGFSTQGGHIPMIEDQFAHSNRFYIHQTSRKKKIIDVILAEQIFSNLKKKFDRKSCVNSRMIESFLPLIFFVEVFREVFFTLINFLTFQKTLRLVNQLDHLVFCYLFTIRIILRKISVFT